jgi:hypothetical protein
MMTHTTKWFQAGLPDLRLGRSMARSQSVAPPAEDRERSIIAC